MSALSDVIDNLRQLNSDERRMIMVLLAKSVQSDQHDSDDFIRLVDENDSLVGVVFPFKPGSGKPPVLTPEEEEEDRRAMQNTTDFLTTEELRENIHRSFSPEVARP